MNKWPLAEGVPPEICGEFLQENGWTLGGNYDESVFVWFAGKPCATNTTPTGRCYRDPCDKCYADPDARYARDVLCRFIMAGGATHPRQVEWVEEINKFGVHLYDGQPRRWRVTEEGIGSLLIRDSFLTKAEANLAMKRRILRLFSGPVEDEKCKTCDGHEGIIYGAWRAPFCDACHGFGVIHGGGVRIVRRGDVHLGSCTSPFPVGENCDCPGVAEIAPAQLLPPAETEYALRPAAARV